MKWFQFALLVPCGYVGACGSGSRFSERNSQENCIRSGKQTCQNASHSYAAKFYKNLDNLLSSMGRKLQRLPRGNVVKTLNRCEKSEDRMSFLKVARLCVPAMALLVGCTTKQATPSGNGSGVEFVAAFRQAHEQRDLEAMSKLYCGDRVTPEVTVSAQPHEPRSRQGRFEKKAGAQSSLGT